MSSISSISSSTQEFESPSRATLAVYHLRRNPLVVLGIIIAVLWVVIAFIAPAIAPYPPLEQHLADRLGAPDATYIMGTDELGRDIFSRVLWGARITVPAGLAVIAIGSTLGVIIGAIAGYAVGIVDELLMRLTELFMAFPFIILAMAVTAALGPDIQNAVLALAVVWWPRYARVLRGLVLEVKAQEYVEAARSVGAGGPYVLARLGDEALALVDPAMVGADHTILMGEDRKWGTYRYYLFYHGSRHREPTDGGRSCIWKAAESVPARTARKLSLWVYYPYRYDMAWVEYPTEMEVRSPRSPSVRKLWSRAPPGGRSSG